MKIILMVVLAFSVLWGVIYGIPSGVMALACGLAGMALGGVIRWAARRVKS